MPGLSAKLAEELHSRLVGLNSYLDLNNSNASEGTFTSTLAAFDGEVAPPAGPGGPKYYDDNDWMGIELVRSYELTHKPATLGSAEAIMAFEMAGWDAKPRTRLPGRHPVLEHDRKRNPQHGHQRARRPSSRCSSTGSPRTSSTSSSP